MSHCMFEGTVTALTGKTDESDDKSQPRYPVARQVLALGTTTIQV
jgi:hypothetical protein